MRLFILFWIIYAVAGLALDLGPSKTFAVTLVPILLYVAVQTCTTYGEIGNHFST